MIAMLLFVVFLLLLVWIWMKESRIYLFLFHKLVFPARTGAAIHVNKQLHFADSITLENNWQLIAHELNEVIRRKTPLPKFHEVDKANHKISFDEGPAWKAVVLKAYD